jgi:hypothetical protein
MTDAKIQTPDMGAGGAMVGRALEGFGQQLGGAAQDFQVIAAAQDNAATKEAANHVDTTANDILFTGQNPYFDTRGRDALASREDTEKQLDAAIAEARKGLKTQRQLEMFDSRVNQQRLSWGARIADHAHTQAFKYDDEQSEASVLVAGQSAAANYLDPEQSRRDLDTGIANVRHRGQLNGWSPEATKVEELKFTSGVHRTSVSALSMRAGRKARYLPKPMRTSTAAS